MNIHNALFHALNRMAAPRPPFDTLSHAEQVALVLFVQMEGEGPDDLTVTAFEARRMLRGLNRDELEIWRKAAREPVK